MIEIKDKKDCCGCWACENACPKHCISMVEDEEGFRYPQMDMDTCIDCHLCEKVCPILNVEKEKPFAQTAFLLQHKDKQVLRESTSGGAFTALGEWVISQGGVVFGAAFTDDFEVRHVMVDKVEELKKFRNSKYVQSQIEDTYLKCKEMLRGGVRRVLFSGTPCQIEGLLRYLRKPYSNLLLVDVVCRAVPSPLLLRKYIEYRKNNSASSIRSIRFRDKHYGYQYSSFTFAHEDGKEDYHRGVESDPYLRAFFSNTSVRPSCYECRFKKRYRVSDLTIWDCFQPDSFGVDKLEYAFSYGVTRVLVHSDKGREAMENIRQFAAIKEIDTEKAVKGVREMVECVPMNARRPDFFRDLDSIGFERTTNKYFPVTIKVRAERLIRVSFFKLGIYYAAKKLFKVFYKNKKNQKS